MILFIIFFIYIYFRFKYGFWFYQPVFHIYDFKYYLFPPGIIEHKLPDKNKYTNFKNIDTISFDKVSDLKINKFINFIQVHYLQNKNNFFLPKKENIIPYFSHLNAPSYFSFYYEDILLQDSKTNETINDKKIISVMTSKPLNIIINNGYKDDVFDVYYVDYLCVDKEYRKKGISPQMIQTHHYNQRHFNKNISISLFKREGVMTGIVPLCIYSTYAFSMKKWNIPYLLPQNYSIIECNTQNFHLIVSFLREKVSKFDIYIASSYSNILELMKTNNIYIYFILKNHEIQSVYFFKKTCTFIDTDEEILVCFASINNMETSELFIQGYKNALYKIIEKNKQFKCCVIENISHNDIIIQNILLKTKPFIISPTAYFFYNFAYLTFKSSKVFILL